MRRRIIEISAGTVFTIGVGMVLLEFVFQYELFPYSGAVGFAVCLICAYIVTAVVMKERPNVSKKDLSKVKFPNGGYGG